MKILHLLATADFRAGGPTESVRQSSASLIAMGHHVEVVTLDDPAAPYLSAFPLVVHALGPGRGNYKLSPGLVPWLREHGREYDAAIVNGLWQYHGYAAWKTLRALGVPYYVFPHGMLDPWFKRTYPLKHLKKWLYWPWFEYRVLRDAHKVLFTAQEELLLARQSFWLYRAQEEVVSFGTSTPPENADELRQAFQTAHPELAGKRLLLFLGRIHQKKGCDILIEAYAKVAALDPSSHLVIAGPDSAQWMAALQSLARELGVAERITWTGMLQAQMKWGAFYASDAFVLPSHQENFGIAVAEALGCGLPVLISDKINIWREVQADGAGLVAPDTVDGTAQNLRHWLELDPASRATMRAQASESFKRRFTVDAMSRDLLRVLQPHARNTGNSLGDCVGNCVGNSAGDSAGNSTSGLASNAAGGTTGDNGARPARLHAHWLEP
jgi:glycosyltransferase involved in cell wall biosynthesis